MHSGRGNYSGNTFNPEGQYQPETGIDKFIVIFKQVTIYFKTFFSVDMEVKVGYFIIPQLAHQFIKFLIKYFCALYDL